MRLDALAHFTARLPHLEIDTTDAVIGTDTESSMISGVYFGIIFEMNGFMESYSDEFNLGLEEEEEIIFRPAPGGTIKAPKIIFHK